MKHQTFTGVWIPSGLIDLKVSWTKRILLAEINQLSMLDKGCVASNSHFSEKYNLSKQAISKALNELEKDEFIIIDNAQTKRNYGRRIGINFSKSAINFGVSAIHESGESKENKSVNKKDIYADLKKEFNISQESIDEILKHRKDIGSKKPTPKALRLMLNGMKKTVSLGIKPNMKSCLRHLIDETTWQSFKPEYFDSSLNSQKTSNEKLHFLGAEE